MSYATSAAGAWIGAVGALSEGIAQDRAHRYNAYVATINAQAQRNALEFEADQQDRQAVFSEQDAEMAKHAAAFRAQQLRLARARQQGANRVAIGASGVTFAGSPLETLAENAYQAETEILLTEYGGEMEARALAEQAMQARLGAEARRYEGRRSILVGNAEAALQRFYGRQARTASYLKTVAIGISSAGSSVGQGMSGGMGGGMGG